MTNRNIHGNWTMSFESRLLKTKVIGATNSEAAKSWLEEAKRLVLSSSEKDETPWVVWNDCREWGSTALDASEEHNHVIDWLSEHNCILYAVVFSKKFQQFSASSAFESQTITRYFFDGDEAYQACLDKLAIVHEQNNK
ncbi:hypothetical protein L4C34_12770 [Vibrio profundum]|uniref:hypothetical protein n=1 Tax=Vibrio profundum TaxID=2910247 RepID=UPI003D139EC9